jgi:Spy/CpxP family protein refolding chaperone
LFWSSPLALLLFPCTVMSPTSPYAGQQARTIKALSPEEVAALLNAEGMGMAKAAELNGYPGPAHVLTLVKELKLTTAQQQQVQAIYDQMKAGAKPLGAELVQRERVLDQLFSKGEITFDRLVTETVAIAELQGRLRSVHLAAHLDTRRVLNPDQIILYERLRGYGDPATALEEIETPLILALRFGAPLMSTPERRCISGPE